MKKRQKTHNNGKTYHPEKRWPEINNISGGMLEEIWYKFSVKNDTIREDCGKAFV